MSVTRQETAKYPDRPPSSAFLATIEPNYAPALASFYSRLKLTSPSFVLVGGSGYGVEVLTINKAFPEAQIIALDSNTKLAAEVKERLSRPVREENALLHEFIESAQDHFDLIVISTGRNHGINSPDEQDRLVACVNQGGLILSGPDSLKRDSFTVTQRSTQLVEIELTGLLSLPRGWMKK